MDAFRGLGGEVIVSGPTKTSIRAGNGLQVDLRVVTPECWGAALQYFTGSQAHNVAVRAIAVRHGLKLSEYGLFRGEELIASATEEDVYAALGMEWVPPPMREDTGSRHRRARDRRPGQPAVRGGHRAARLADRRRRDQYVAVGETLGVPSQGTFDLKVTRE